MQIELESSLRRWTEAGLVNAGQADRIKEFESLGAPERGGRLPIFIGLALGGVMLMAGVLLFVSARWEDFSPTLRMTLLVSAMGGFHVVAAFCAERFPRDGDHDARNRNGHSGRGDQTLRAFTFTCA